MEKRLDYEFLFNELFEIMLNLYDFDELCAKFIEMGLNDNQLFYLGFEIENIENGKKIREEW